MELTKHFKGVVIMTNRNAKFNVFAMLLAVLIVISALPISVSAETYGDLTYKIVHDEAVVTGCSMQAYGTVAIPSTLDGYPVTRIYSGTFFNCLDVSKIIIPNSIEVIEPGAFVNCIPEYGFAVDEGNRYYSNDDYGVLYNKDKTTLIKAKSSLYSYTIPTSVTCIAEDAFNNCELLKEIVIGENVSTIESGSFSGCEKLTSVIIPNSVTTIGSSAFFECRSLSDVIIGENVISIGEYAFSCCNGLTDINIPNSVKEIGRAFDRCPNLVSVTIGSGVTILCYRAFWGCEALTTITLGLGIKSISNDAFEGCSNLIDVYYKGTETQWKNITIGSDNFILLNRAYIHFESEEVSGNTESSTDKEDKYTDPTEPSTGNMNMPTDPTEPSSGIEDKPTVSTDSSVGGENNTTDQTELSTEVTEKPSESTRPIEDIGVLGDVNGDGKVNIKDATAIQKHIANLTSLAEKGYALADVTQDAKVNIKDATAIQKHIAGIETGLPIGRPKSNL